MSSKKVADRGSSGSGKKRLRIVDDDFEDVCIFSTDDDDSRNSKTLKPCPTDADFAVLSHRTTPKILIDAIAEMNDMQRRSIYNMGFGFVFKIGVREIPCSMAHWCVDSFRPRSCSFVLPGGNSVHILDKDVWLALGFLRGGTDIVRIPKFQRNPLIDRWDAEIGKKKTETLPADVIRAMLSDLDSGRKL